jgi:hypothetical protein
LDFSDSDFGKIQGSKRFRRIISKTFSFWAHFHLPKARLRQVKTALSAIMKTLMRFHTASIACAV